MTRTGVNKKKVIKVDGYGLMFGPVCDPQIRTFKSVDELNNFFANEQEFWTFDSINFFSNQLKNARKILSAVPILGLNQLSREIFEEVQSIFAVNDLSMTNPLIPSDSKYGAYLKKIIDQKKVRPYVVQKIVAFWQKEKDLEFDVSVLGDILNAYVETSFEDVLTGVLRLKRKL
jgi:hypothetical protein